MESLSNTIPEIKIEKIQNDAKVNFSQVLGSFMEPKLGESACFALYEVMKGKGLLSLNRCYVRGKAKIHGVECYESVSKYNNFNDDKTYEIISYDHITDGKVRSLAYLEEYPNGTREFYTFKDQHFLDHWALGEDGKGVEVSLQSRNLIVDEGECLKVVEDKVGLYDLTGFYDVTINGKKFRLVRLVLLAAENQVSDFFIDEDGKELFHRFFIPDEGFGNNESPYSTQYLDAQSISVNNRKCVCTTYVIRGDLLGNLIKDSIRE